MKLFLSHILYFLGDIISRTVMQFGRGYGYSIYRQLMLWSCDLDSEGKIWKFVKEKTPNKHKNMNKKISNKRKPKFRNKKMPNKDN
jgi:hypothetical protein